jgi:serine/threonine-protein kinase
MKKGTTTHVDSNDKPEKKKRKKWPFILGSLIFVMLLGIFTVTMLPDLLGPDEVEVPDVSGQEYNKAKTELENEGFTIGEEIEVNDEEIPVGYIIKTNPDAGKTVKEKATIDLYISKGKKTFELSDYVGRLYDDVYQLVEDKNFKDIKKNQVYDASEPGTILEQSPSANEEVIAEDTILEFTVSKGQELIKLKDLTGFNQTSVEEYLESTGLKIDLSSSEFHDTLPEGTVIRQSPDPGTELKKGDMVKVILSKGKEEIPPKTVKVPVFIPYEPIVEGTPQVVRIYIEDMTRSMTTPYETFTITGPEERILEFLIPYGEKAGYKIFRDDVVIEEEPVDYPEE